MRMRQVFFRAWLQWICKSGPLTVFGEKAKAKELAAAMGISAPTLSGLHSGRVMPGGDRHFPDINLHRQAEILHITGVNRNEAIDIGRRIQAASNLDLHKRVDVIESKMSNTPEKSNQIDLTEHQRKVERFKNKKLGESINEKLLEIEELEPDQLLEIDETLDIKLKRLKRKYEKKA